MKPQSSPAKAERARSTSGKTVSPARRAAFEILLRVEKESAFASTLLATLDQEMRTDDRALTHELVLGVLRHQLWLDRLIEYFAGRRVESLDIAVKLALRLGLYQIRYLSRTPDSAAVNESVNLVHAARLQSATSFANAVLRRATREVDYDPAAGLTDALERISVATSHPIWLLERWVRYYGSTAAEAFALANNQPAPVAFRFTPRAGEKESILDELRAAGAFVQPSRLAREAWRVKGAAGVLQKLAREGVIYLQDEASQIVANVVAPRVGERVLDVCAAPGSKTLHLSAMQPAAFFVAGDLYEHRLETLRHLAGLHDIKTIELLAHDAATALPFASESFDAVLVDAPCTGTGTLRHNPEIRWRIKPDDIKELAERQQAILRNSASLVRPGGRLIYSTCSVEPEENEDVIQAFLAANSEFQVVQPDWKPREGDASDFISESGAIRTWPQRDDVDGFFIVALMRL